MSDVGGGADLLVGRENVLAALRSALDRAAAGSGRLVLISGEPGIGKSAVLDRLTDEAGDDLLVLAGICWDGQGAPPYWPWSQVLRASRLTRDELGDGARLFDAGAAGAPGDAAQAADARFRMFDAVARALGGVAARRTLLVTLEDLHWADEASLALLAFLARMLASAQVLLVGTYRDTEAPAQLIDLAGQATHLELGALKPTDVERLLLDLPSAAGLHAGMRRQLWERSGGNPFFLLELIRLIQAHGAGQLAGRLPDTVIEAVRRRLARLSSDCAVFLEWAALAGRAIDLDLLVECGAVNRPTAGEDLLAEAGRARIIRLGAEPQFAHDLYRDAILAGVGGARLAAMHLATAVALKSHSPPASAARIADHLLRAGPEMRSDAVEYSLRAARAATARLGHTDAAQRYAQALALLDDDTDRCSVTLALAAAYARAGSTAAARERYQQAGDLALTAGDAVAVAHAALGLHALGQRSGAHAARVREALEQATRLLDDADGPLALRSEVVASLVRVRRHGEPADQASVLVPLADRAVELANHSGEPVALARAWLAVHDARWVPGNARDRLPVVAAMSDAARVSGDADLIALAEQLRATALLELGDPAGRDALLRYIDLAGGLGHARGRWGALSRQATFAQLAGRGQEAARLGEQALALGEAIGEPDAVGCFCTHRWSLVALGVDPPELPLDAADPIWPLLPLIAAWAPAVRGDSERARTALGDFSVVDIRPTRDLERLAVAAVVFAEVGSDEQRRWTYEQLQPYAGNHVVVGGCAAYHAAVDHHLGTLAHSLGDRDAANAHYSTALSLHQRLGAAGWERLTRHALARLAAADQAPHQFHRDGDGWAIRFGGRQIRMPAAKGLHDIWIIIGAAGRGVHVRTLIGDEAAAAAFGAGPVLDRQAGQAYRARIMTLDEAIEDADRRGDPQRSDRLHSERSDLIRELAAARGLGGRPRRLNDDAERARKTVSARVRDVLGRLDRTHPALAAHLRSALQLGTICTYRPAEPTQWMLR